MKKSSREKAAGARLKKAIAKKPKQAAKPIKLTPQIIRLIQLICDQKTSEEIAAKMKLSKRTVEDYRSAALERTGVKNTAGLVVYAIKHGIYKIK